MPAQSQLATNHSASPQSGALGSCRKGDTVRPEEGRVPGRMGHLTPLGRWCSGHEGRRGTWSQDAGINRLPLITTEWNNEAWDGGTREGQGKGESGL